jgi:hypothetical protein
MGNRQLIKLAIVAFILTSAMILVGALEDRQEVTLKEGSYLLAGFNPEKVRGIYIQKGGNRSRSSGRTRASSSRATGMPLWQTTRSTGL